MMSTWRSWRLAVMLGGLALVGLAVLLPGESARGSPDATVRMGSGFVDPGFPITLDLEADVIAPDGPLGAFTIEVGYDPALVSGTACTADPDAIFDFSACNPAFAPGVARCTGVSIGGVSGLGLRLCDITFTADPGAPPGSVVPLPVGCLVLTSPGGDPIPCMFEDGEITIGPPNEPPVCAAPVESTPQDTPVTFALPCSDPDSGPGPLTCDVVTPPPNGGVVVSDCSATYTPNPGFTGQDCFDYEAFDGQDFSSPPATACVDVTPVAGIVVRMGSGSVAPGGQIVLDLDALDVPPGSLGAFTMEVGYDPALLDGAACVPDPDTIFDFADCNPDFAPGIARCTGVSISGVSGAELTLCDITFQADASVPLGTMTPLSVVCVVLTDPSGTPIPCIPQNGEIQIVPTAVTVSVGDGFAPPGGSVTLPVEVVGVPAGSLGAATIDVEYDPAVLDATDCTPDPDGVFDLSLCSVTVDNDDVPPDAVRCTAVSVLGVSGDLLVCTITFDVIACESGDTTTVTPNVETLTDPNGNPILFITDPGEVTCGRLGDVNCDGLVDAVDALFVLQFVLVMKTGDVVCPPLPVPPAGPIFLPACDVNDDGLCDAVDALFILQCVLVIRDCYTFEPLDAQVGGLGPVLRQAAPAGRPPTI